MLDVLIIGGGILGAGVAADAAQRGLRVALCEKNDLASGTSSYSSKLVHGGLRYLEQYQWRMVKEALQERETLLRVAPHLTHPLPFIFPHTDTMRPWWKIRLGVWLYDQLSPHEQIPTSRTVFFSNPSPLKTFLKKGLRYWDCQTDDVRLVISNALAAQHNGATIFTRAACTQAVRESDHWNITLSNGTTLQARVLINATGAWITNTFAQTLNEPSPYDIHWVKGSHIIVPAIHHEKIAYTLQQPDGRVVFVLPYENDFSLIGTTDVTVDDLNNISASEEEINYLLDAVNRYFTQSLARSDVVYHFAGVRGLYGKHFKEASKISRDYKIDISQQTPALISLFGGKLTTYRFIAEKTVDALRAYFPALPACRTADTPLPGGYFSGGIETLINDLQQQYPYLPDAQLSRYARLYGARCHLFLKGTTRLNDLGQHFGADLYEKEVRYLMAHEWAQTAEDILWRRTKLQLVLTHDQQATLSAFMQMADH
jgi:glycerol-3-phosphate dehydrogenase